MAELEQRSYVKICALHGDSASHIHHILEAVCGASALHYSAVAKWVKQFNEGRQSTEDQPSSGRSLSTKGPDRDIIKST